MKKEINGNNARLILSEELDLTNLNEIDNEFNKLLEQGVINIVLDLKDLKKIDSSGLGKILHFNKVIEENNGKLIIENIKSDYVQRVFKMIDLNDIIEIKS